MSRARGRRYDKEPKLNMKKVIAVILAIIVIIMFVIIINIVTSDGENSRISSLSYFASFNDNKWGVIDSNRKRCNKPII